MTSDHLLLFTRYPTPGDTKTRIIPALGADGAADLQEWLTGHSVMAGNLWAAQNHGQLQILTTGAPLKKFRNWLGPGPELREQSRGDLGDRLRQAGAAAFAEGAERVAFTGIDCPDLGPDHIQAAFDALEDHDVSILPATDGGYVLLALRNPCPGLFTDIPWGGSDVLAATREQAGRNGLRVWEGSALADIDLPEDLPALPAWRDQDERLTLVIPSLNEEGRIPDAVASALPGAEEVIVVDGGSADRTVERAREAGARVVSSPPGRAVQMNTGAWEAGTGRLLFLHADCTLPPGYAEEVHQMLTRPGVGMGAFPLAIDAKGTGYRMLERGIHLRSRCRQRPYGDQALFLSRDLFERLGGFPMMPLLEDLNLVQRISQRRKIGLASLPVTCSARRWQQRGKIRTTLRNQAILTAYALGVSPRTLATWYA